MPVLVVCRSCGVKLRIPDKIAGRKAKCPNCNTAIVLSNPFSQDLVPAHLVAATQQQKKMFSKADMEAVALCAQRISDLIYESMNIARTSRNPNTKISRLRFAKQKIEEIKHLAAKYPFLELPNLKKIETRFAQIGQEVEHREIDKAHIRSESLETEKNEFWFEKVRRLKTEGCSDNVICECRKNIPYPAAFREIAISIRKDIRAKRKEKLDACNLLLKLYQWAVIENFFAHVDWNKIINERILHSTARLSIKDIKTPYEIIGYKNLALLNKTDVKWFVEAFGEPSSHSTAKDANSELWNRAVKTFQAASERDKQHFWRSHGFDGPQ